jgi:hypothetical protein
VKHDLRDSPEEFRSMCGIVGYCILNKDRIEEIPVAIRPYGSQASALVDRQFLAG